MALSDWQMCHDRPSHTARGVAGATDATGRARARGPGMPHDSDTAGTCREPEPVTAARTASPSREGLLRLSLEYTQL
eukprot:759416-Hanusia_phi.AAC.1